nr:MAG: hypothetical protein [Rhabdoviridae sp.]WAK77098.1 MAG: hypothetical protein [Rhabdoviridae sp.]
MAAPIESHDGSDSSDGFPPQLYLDVLTTLHITGPEKVTTIESLKPLLVNLSLLVGDGEGHRGKILLGALGAFESLKGGLVNAAMRRDWEGECGLRYQGEPITSGGMDIRVPKTFQRTQSWSLMGGRFDLSVTARYSETFIPPDNTTSALSRRWREVLQGWRTEQASLESLLGVEETFGV